MAASMNGSGTAGIVVFGDQVSRIQRAIDAEKIQIRIEIKGKRLIRQQVDGYIAIRINCKSNMIDGVSRKGSLGIAQAFQLTRDDCGIGSPGEQTESQTNKPFHIHSPAL